jgi:deazaflavin-dependent oxidoreductase (nitroreductase family)
MTDDVVDSPNAFVADHIRRFEATGGHPRPGIDDLLLTTRGRRSGQLRRTALVYARDGYRYVVAASNAGADRHPAWYLNLVADPRVTVQVGTRTFAATAHTAGSDERPGLWALMVATMPSYRSYQDATSREIPVVVIYGGR